MTMIPLISWCFLFCGLCLILRCYYNALYFLSQGSFFFFQAVQSFFSSYIFCYYVYLFNQNLRLKCFYVFLFFIFFLYFFSCFSFNTLFSSFYLSNCLSLSEACLTRPLKNLLLSWVLFVHLLFSHIGY